MYVSSAMPAYVEPRRLLTCSRVRVSGSFRGFSLAISMRLMLRNWKASISLPGCGWNQESLIGFGMPVFLVLDVD